MTPRPFVSLPALVLAIGFAACSKAPRSTPGRTVVLISIDTLRPERLGVYGNSADVSPAIDQLARDGVVFEQSLAVAPWTLPAHMTMLTGLDPLMHGVRTPTKKLPERVNTVAEILRAQGFRTAAFTDDGFVGKGYGFEQGFEVFDADHGQGPKNIGFARYLEDVREWTSDVGDQPLFLFLHSFDAHAPYQEGDPKILAKFRERPTPDGPDDHQLYRGSFTHYARSVQFDKYTRMSELWNDYDAGIHEADRAVQEVVTMLRELGRYDDAVIIVTSDHGESFYDHGLWVGHGIGLTNDEIRTPLIVKFPKSEGAGRRETSLVDQVDVAPTILDVASVPTEPFMRGTSLRAIARGEKRARSYSFGGCYATEAHFLVRNDLKYISEKSIPPINTISEHLEPSTPDCISKFVRGSERSVEDGAGGVRVSSYSFEVDPLGLTDSLRFHEQLFDRASDPGEQHDLAASRTSELEEMRKSLTALILESQRIHGELDEGASTRDLSINEVRKLQALGYAVGAETTAVDINVDETIAKLREAGRPPERDVQRLIEVDRRLHKVRLGLREERALGDVSAELNACAEEAVQWLVEHPEHSLLVRSLWRVHEAAALAKRASVTFDVPYFTNRLHATLRAANVPDGEEQPENSASGDAQHPQQDPSPRSKDTGQEPKRRPS